MTEALSVSKFLQDKDPKLVEALVGCLNQCNEDGVCRVAFMKSLQNRMKARGVLRTEVSLTSLEEQCGLPPTVEQELEQGLISGRVVWPK